MLNPFVLMPRNVVLYNVLLGGRRMSHLFDKKSMQKSLSWIFVMIFIMSNLVIYPAYAKTESVTVMNGDFSSDFTSDGSWTRNGAGAESITYGAGWGNLANGYLDIYMGTGSIAYAEQTLSGLEPGDYELSAYYYSSGVFNSVNMYAKDFGGDEVTGTMKAVSTGWEKVTLNFTITEGQTQCTVGFYVDGKDNAWIGIDDVSLTRTYIVEDDPNAVAISNASFEADNAETTGDISNWTEKGVVDASQTVAGGYDGSYSLKHSFASDYEVSTEQILTNLETGYYTLTAMVKSSGDQDSSYIYAQVSGESLYKTAVPPASDWKSVTIRGIHIQDGSCTIGFYSNAGAGQFLLVDDVKMTKDDKAFDFYIGGDLSAVNYVEDQGGKYFDRNGNEKDVFQILAEEGYNIVRLRLYNDPGPGHGSDGYYCPEGYMNKEDILDLAKRAKDAGIDIQLSFHYSDYWTNGGLQNIPNDWAGLSAVQLETEVYNYTKDVLEAMVAQGTAPVFVSLGNEIQAGMLFPYGKATSETWDQLAAYFNAGARAVREIVPNSKIILHLDDAGNLYKYQNFFDNCKSRNVDYDIIGASYYPYWTDKSVEQMVTFCNTLVNRYDKDIMFMETGYNYTPFLPTGELGQLEDVGPYDETYQSTPEGQKKFMIDLFNGLKNVKDGRVLGDLYWDPVFIETEGVGWALNDAGETQVNAISNTTHFDFDGKALPVLQAYVDNTQGRTTGMLSGRIEGTNGRGIAGAQVQLKRDGALVKTIVTNALGDFFVPYLPADNKYSVEVSCEGYSSGTKDNIEVVLGQVNKSTVVLNGSSIQGNVKDDDGQALAAAMITATIGEREYSTLTDAHGNYQLNDLPSGDTYVVEGSKLGYLADSKSDVVTNIGETTNLEDMTLVLNSGVVIGKIVDENQDPLEAAMVTVITDKDKLSGITDDQGEFNIPFVEPSDVHQIQIELSDYVTKLVEDISVAVKQTTDIGTQTLIKDSGSISGVLINDLNKTVAGATVFVKSDENTYSVASDANGKFYFPDVLTGQDYVLYAEKEGYRSFDTKGISVNLQQETKKITVRLMSPITIVNPSFEIAGANGNLLEGWNVVDTQNATIQQARIDSPFGNYTLSTWADKAYTSDVSQTIDGLSPGKYVLTALIYNAGTQIENYLYVKENNQQTAKLDFPKGAWLKVQMDFDVTTSSITIGKYENANAGDWCVLEEVELSRLSDLEKHTSTTVEPSPVTITESDNSLVLTPKEQNDLDKYSLELPMDKILTYPEQQEVIVKTSIGVVTLPISLLESLDKSKEALSINIENVSLSTLSEKERKFVGDKPVINVDLLSGNKILSVNQTKEPITIAIPYEATEEELLNPEQIIIYYLSPNGKVVPVTSSMYDPITKMVSFEVHHLSKYAVGYNHITIQDVPKKHWAYVAISNLVAKDLIELTKDQAFSPKSMITRGEFIIWLVNALELQTDLSESESFLDVSTSDNAFSAIGTAKSLGIIKGINSNQFNPGGKLSREDMMVILYRALTLGKTNIIKASKHASSGFSDQNVISDYTRNAIDYLVDKKMILGNSGVLNPKGMASKSEAALVIYRLLQQ